MALRQVFKYYLPIHGLTGMPVPMGAQVVHVDEQDGKVTIWMEVDPDAPRRERVFFSYFTGEDINPWDVYCGTAKLDDGKLLVHVYERIF
jgi:hypothetical protein